MTAYSTLQECRIESFFESLKREFAAEIETATGPAFIQFLTNLYSCGADDTQKAKNEIISDSEQNSDYLFLEWLRANVLESHGIRMAPGLWQYMTEAQAALKRGGGGPPVHHPPSEASS